MSSVDNRICKNRSFAMLVPVLRREATETTNTGPGGLSHDVLQLAFCEEKPCTALLICFRVPGG